jgi:hypothetical protein
MNGCRCSAYAQDSCTACPAGNEQVVVHARLKRQLGQVVSVLDEGFAEESLRVERATGRGVHERLQFCPRLFVRLLLLDQVHEPAEEVGRELQVDTCRLIVQQRNALAHPIGDQFARRRKGGDLGWSGRRQASPNRLLLPVE